MDQAAKVLAKWLGAAAAGLFSWAMIDLVLSGRLKYYLADQKFEVLVMAGGVLLGLIVLLRVRTMLLGGAGHLHDHDHDHGEAGHDHEHGVSTWRLAVLAMPLMIVVMGLVPKGLSADAALHRMTRSQREAISAVQSVTLPSGREGECTVINTDARELQAAAHQPNVRAYWQDEKQLRCAKLSGQLLIDPRFQDRYRLTRFKITCCAADASPMVVTVVGKVDPGWRERDWLEVTGPVSFVEVPDERTGRPQFFPVVYQQHAERTTAKDYLQ